VRSAIWIWLYERNLRSRIFIWALLALALFNSSLHAHGGGTPRLVNAGDGPYRIFAWTQPEPLRAGEIHISIAITEPPPEGSKIDDSSLSNELERVVQGAEITLLLASINEPDAVIEVSAAASTVSEFYYEADLILPTEGVWRMRLVAKAEAGVSQAEFRADVLPARQVNWTLVGGGAVLFILLSVSLGFRVRQGNKEA